MTATWPYDAERSDPLAQLRIPVTASHPEWAYLVAFDRDSAMRPTDAEAAMIASFRDFYIQDWYRPGYVTKMRERPFDIDGGANGIVFHKWGLDDWGYRRRSWNRGPLFWPGPASYRKRHAPEVEVQSLLRLMDHIRGYSSVTEPNPKWEAWKAAHRDVFGGR